MTTTLYLSSPEGNAFYIIGRCLQVLERFYPDTEERKAAIADFCERAADSQYESLLALVEEISQGDIVFNREDMPSEHTLTLAADEIKHVQMVGMLTMAQLNPPQPSIR